MIVLASDLVSQYAGPLAVGGATLAAVFVYVFVRFVLPLIMGGGR